MKLKYLSILITIFFSSGCAANPMLQFQEDADLIRLEHLEYWTQIFEQYSEKKGHFPFQNEVKGSEEIVLVKIATKQQMSYLSAGGKNYNEQLDNNQSGRFKEYNVKQLVAEIESVLGREIKEKYDIQKVPTRSPVGYFYFATNDGYLLWVTCITCDVTLVSTLLYDGYTPTVNIVSKGMAGKVPKALIRNEMVNHPTYKAWVSRPFHKEEYVRNLVEENSHDSKK